MNNENKSQQGTGSAENTGQDRSTQQNNAARLSDQQKQDIAREIGEERDEVADVQDMGTLSGRDDASGGSGDDMEGQDTGRETER
ncbi:MAG TPA: hypothetical protein VD996_05360 [Chitinophagaceae bacterium]|nr:hypothetical protein [Chitinophagaceae bacterium]